MIKKLLIVVFNLYFFIGAQAQQISHGPIVGGVSDTSARFMLFSTQTAQLGIQISLNANFNPILMQHSQMSDASLGNAATFNFSGLQPKTQYFYRATINGAFINGDVRKFKTFPEKADANNYVITFGSCQNEDRTQDEVFSEMLNHNSDLFLQVGDWGYPDFTESLPNNPDFFPADFNRLITAYKNKYDYTFMKEFLKTVAIDYVWDDHDYVNDNTSKSTASFTSFGIPTQVLEIPIPAQTRRNSIDAYYKLFPGYEPVDSSEGIFHRFVFGNVEVFMLDDRAARSSNTTALVNVNGDWQFIPPIGHTIIGDAQRTWLLDRLKKSTATWKLITTATAFNKTYRNVINPLLNLPQLAGLPLVAAIIDSWSGFPADQDSLINCVNQNGIDGVLMLSGDTHTSAMDDGSSGGLPEIMAGDLSQNNSTLFTTVPLLQFGLEWNKGGQGISTNNTNTAFGKLSVFGDDSLEMRLIDVNGILIAKHTLYSCSFLSGLKINAQAQNITCKGKQDGKIVISASGGNPPYAYTLNGEVYQSDSVFSNLLPGKYYPAIKDNSGCIKQMSIEISEPDTIIVNLTTVDATCPMGDDGKIFFFLSGGMPPFQWDWSNGNTSASQQDLSPGNYTISATDAAGCTLLFSIDINSPDTLVTHENITSATCKNNNDGSIELQFDGATPPYAILWGNGSADFDRMQLAPGTYSYTITDAAGCVFEKQSTVSSPSQIVITATVIDDTLGLSEGAIFLNVNGGTPPYSFVWFQGQTDDFIENVGVGNYFVQVTDANGCRNNALFVVDGPTSANTFTFNKEKIMIFPNPAQDELFLSVDFELPVSLSLTIFNVLGQFVFEQQYTGITQEIIPISLHNFFTGQYIVQLKNKNKIEHFRFIIKH